MKYIHLIILLISTLPGFTQVQVNISGHVTEGPVGSPVPMQPVFFSIVTGNDSVNMINDFVLTNDSGFYSYDFPMAGSLAIADISTPDCNGTMLLYTHVIDSSMRMITQDFYICHSTSCQASFTYYPDTVPTGSLYQFIDLSDGDITSWSWSFGDGGYSQEQNPVHLYQEEGTYEVCLAVSGPVCQSTWCETVTVILTYGGCYNYFTYEKTGNTVNFQGNHFPGESDQYLWDFGDGSTGEGQETNHTYQENGVYYVSLMTTDSLNCTAFSGQMLTIGDTVMFSQVYGQVFEGYLPMQEGHVIISSLPNNPGFEPFTEVAPVDSAGIFVFPYIPFGQFLLYAVPEGENGYLPTYYGGSRHWTDATAFSSMESGMLFTINLEPAHEVNVWGSGLIAGFFNGNILSDNRLQLIQVILYNDSFEPIGFESVRPDGSFEFSGLAEGLYYIYPELPGINSTIMPVELTSVSMESIVYLGFDGTSILGEEELGIAMEDVRIYPNPASTRVFISYPKINPGILSILVSDLNGRVIFSHNHQVISEQEAIEIPLLYVVPGIYLMKITEDSGKSFTGKFIKTD